MSQAANVQSIDALKVFRIALIKFAEAANVALGDAESELQRVQMWLENEQPSLWTRQIRKRQEVLARALEALRMKKVFKDASGARQSYVDEEKAVAKAQRSLQEAEQKLVATKQWARRFQKESANYKGAVQRLSTFVLADVPVATSQLDRMTAALEAYVALHAPVPTAAPPAEAGASAAMPGADAAMPGQPKPAEATAQEEPAAEANPPTESASAPAAPAGAV